MRTEDEYKTQHQNRAVCPYCGYIHEDCWEWSGLSDPYNCNNCEKPFSWTRIIDAYYSTEKIKETNA